MATYYVDYAVGDDGNAGDAWGAGNAWKTIEHALVAGDLVKVAKSTEAALSGTLTWVDGSNEVATSVDITGEVAVGDFIKKNTETIWWEISAEAADKLTLVEKFRGTGGAGSSSIITPFDTNGDGVNDTTTSGADNNYITIEGGYNTGTNSVDGISFYDGETGAGNGIYLRDSDSYVEYKNFACVNYSYGLDQGWVPHHIKITDCQFHSNTNEGIRYTNWCWSLEFENIKTVGNGGGMLIQANDSKFYGVTESYGNTGNGFYIGAWGRVTLENLICKDNDAGIREDGGNILIRTGEFDDNTKTMTLTRGGEIIFIDTIQGDGTYIDIQQGRGIWIKSVRHNQTTNNHRYDYIDLGVMTSTAAGLADTTVKTAGNVGMRFAPTKASTLFEIEIPIPVVSGQAVTIDGYLRMNSTYQGDADKTLPYIKLTGCGITEDTDSMADSANSWNAVQVTGTPSRSGSAILTISTAANDASSYAYADEFSISGGATNTTSAGFSFWSELNGQPSGLLKGAGGGSYGYVG